jgi:hypothetical protein
MAATAAERMVGAEWEEEEEGKQGMRRRKRYGLVEYRALPAYLRDNEYIHRHYRCEWPLPQVLLSAFSIHNETLNVWTYVNPPSLSALNCRLVQLIDVSCLGRNLLQIGMLPIVWHT